MFHTKTKKTVIIAEILIAVNNYVRIHYLSVFVHLFCNENHKLFSKIISNINLCVCTTMK